MYQTAKNPSRINFDRELLDRQISYNQDNFQKHFADRIQTKNDFYDWYNDILHKKWEQLMEDKGLDIYQRDLINENTIPQNLVIKPNQVSPLLNSVEQENQTLRIEVKKLAQDLQKFISMVELLLEENRYVRDKLTVQNSDLNKIVEIVGINEKEDFNDLKLKIEALNEENIILLQRVEDLTKFKKDYHLLQDKTELELARAKEVFERCNADKEIALKREEQISKQLLILEDELELHQKQSLEFEYKYNQTQKELDQKIFDHDELQKKYNKVERQLHDLQNESQQEIDQLTVELESALEMRQEIKSQFQPYKEENDKLKIDLNNILSQNQQLRLKHDNSQMQTQKYVELMKNEQRKLQEFLNEFEQTKVQMNQIQQQRQFATVEKEHLEQQFNKYLEQKQREVSDIKHKLELESQQLSRQLNEEKNDKKNQFFETQEQIEQYEKEMQKNKRLIQLKDRKIVDIEQHMKNLEIKSQRFDQLQESILQKDAQIKQLQQDCQLAKQDIEGLQGYKMEADTLKEQLIEKTEQLKEMEQQQLNDNINQQIEELEEEKNDLINKIYQVQQEKEEAFTMYQKKQEEFQNFVYKVEQDKLQGSFKTLKHNRDDQVTSIPENTVPNFNKEVKAFRK